ncbi:MAG TPA: ester cyclase [Anaerolineales bacterium]|nr:ester cyclase [Anaerolineales bacterium]HMX18768.1 ester cyclase [Anaerolineales bacterium]HMX74751.1 ester cyclase [Anaerolineales bacterium]HMZ44140.1 ester cyclase [Anaerolineales bacterium]HNA53844.1 ester cyclase [Anaerolineales bacterium]
MEQKEVALSVSKAILNGEWDKLNGILSDDFTYTGDGMFLNKAQYMDFMKGMRAAFSNMNFEFSHVISEGDAVSIRFVVTAKHTGSFMGGAATNKNLNFSGIFIRKVKGDKVVQEWQATDLLGMMTQMGVGTLLGYAIFGVWLKKK